MNLDFCDRDSRSSAETLRPAASGAVIVRALVFAILSLLLVSCSKSWHATTDEKVRTFAQEGGGAGFGGQTMMDTFSTNATVMSIDHAQRKLELKMADGQVTSFQAGTNVFKFEDIKVGDQFKTTLVQELAVSLARAGTPLISNVVAKVEAPPGGMPGYSMITTTNFTARITDIDPVAYAVTLQLAKDQIRTLRIRQGINIANFNPGDIVSVSATEAKALLVEKP
jgi:hypothetical protein